MAARVVAQSKLTDMSEGGEVAGVVGAVAEEVELVESRLKRIRDSFDFGNATGVELDERVRDFPGGGMTRRGASAASGNVVSVTFDAVLAAPLLIPAGTVYGRSDDGSVQYVQTGDVTVPAGQIAYPDTGLGQEYIPVTSTVTGTRANVRVAGGIDTLISGPAGLASSIVSNVELTLTNGTDRETDDELIARGFLYLSSLARTLPAALEFLALSFRPSDGSRIRHAKVFEDPTRPAYAELVVDASIAGRKGIATSGTIPLAGQAILYHEHPASEPITSAQFEVGGAPAPLAADGSVQWISIPERGHLYPSPALIALMPVGTAWSIGSIGNYIVLTGPMAELQNLIEGDLSDPLAISGWRPVGGRVRVMPPLPQTERYSVNIVLLPGTDAEVARTATQDEALAFADDLGPGEPLFRAALTRRLMNAVAGLTNVTFNTLMSDGTTVANTGDVYAQSPRHSIRLTASSFEVV